MHGWIWQDVLVPVSQTEWSHVCYLIINSAASAASCALPGRVGLPLDRSTIAASSWDKWGWLTFWEGGKEGLGT